LIDKPDYIIVGQGLAGSLLACSLLARGCSVRIFDDNHNTASAVAAGLFNPVTGKRWVKTWKAEEIFSKLTEYYPQLEKELGTDFYFPKKLFRPFTTRREQNDWASKSSAELDSLFIGSITEQPLQPALIDNPYGGVLIKNAGYVNVPVLLQKLKQKFIREGILTGEKLNEEQLEITANTVKYHGFEAKKIIFCNGLSSMHGKFFSWLPFNPVKGEILTVDLGTEIDYILSRGIFVIPEAGTQCKVGATYDRGVTDTAISENAREYLLSKVRNLVHSPIGILSQSAGIRPATRDRRPFIGTHPEFKTIAIFNGFGSKGVSLIPYLSEIFTDHLLSGHNLEPDLNIIRYFN